MSTTTLVELETRSLKEAFQAPSGFTSRLEQSELLTAKIPIFDKSVGDVVDIDQVWKEQFPTPVEKYLESAQPTLEGFQTLFQSEIAGIGSVCLASRG